MGRDLEHSKITLNGTDWSNAYILDYPGGAGGELLSEMMARDTRAINFSDKGDSDSVIDSIGNNLSSGNFSASVKKLFGYNSIDDVPKGKSGVNELKKIIKLSLFLRKIEIKSGFSYPNVNLFLNGMTDEVDDLLTNILYSTTNGNIVVRSHHTGFALEQLENAKVLRLYPKSNSDFIHLRLRMGLLKWNSLKQVPKTFYTAETIDENLKQIARKQGDKLFGWQIEVSHKGKQISKSAYDDFLNHTFQLPFTSYDTFLLNDNIIDAHRWLYSGMNENDIEIYENVMNTKYKISHHFNKWRKNNIVQMKNIGIDVQKDISIDTALDVLNRDYEEKCIQLKL